MPMTTFTAIHVLLSLIGIGSGPHSISTPSCWWCRPS